MLTFASLFWRHIGWPALEGAGATLMILLAAWAVGALIMHRRR